MQDTLVESLEFADMLLRQAVVCWEDVRDAPLTRPVMAAIYGEHAKIRQLLAHGHLRQARLRVQDELEGQDTQSLLLSELVGNTIEDKSNADDLQIVSRSLDTSINDLKSLSYANWREDPRALDVCETVRQRIQEALVTLEDTYLIEREQ